MPVLERPPQAITQELRCASCGAALNGEYCARCGQRKFAGRQSLGVLAVDPLRRVLQMDRGFAYTVFGLTVAPGRVVRDYLAGRMAPYTHPVGYLLVSFLIFALVARWAGAAGDLRYFFLPVVVFIAAVSKLLFWRERLNYAEHLILGMYLFGHFALIGSYLFGSSMMFPSFRRLSLTHGCDVLATADRRRQAG
jgi:hypothetical protein